MQTGFLIQLKEGDMLVQVQFYLKFYCSAREILLKQTQNRNKQGKAEYF